MKFFLTAILALMIIVGCESEDQSKESQLIGKWHGKRHTSNGLQEWIVERSDDQKLVIIFKIPKGNSFVYHKEKGSWKVEDDLYSSTTLEVLQKGQLVKVDSSLDMYNHKYSILALTKNVFSYQNIANGDIYNVKKVDEKFKFTQEIQ